MLKVKVHTVPPRYEDKLAQQASLERARASQERAQKRGRDDQGRFKEKPNGRP